MSRTRTAVLISGRGSNMAALIEAAKNPSYPAEISLVLSNDPDAAGLELARKEGIMAIGINHENFETREEFEDALQRELEAAEITLVCCAGFMRLMTESFVEKWRNRMINIHPSLLPAYKGLESHTRVLRDGVRITGCSVHYVRAAMDSGPIIMQAAVPVRNNDTPDSLDERVLKAEHIIYPQALALVARGLVRVAGEEAKFSSSDRESPPLISPAS
ncbi:MAG: phosphoribosylglycinamide formyltransferase [Hyphomicrobiales bacterium]